MRQALTNLIESSEAVLTMLETTGWNGGNTGSNQQTGDLRCDIDEAKDELNIVDQVEVTLTRTQAEQLATLLNMLNGRLQDPTKPASDTVDRTFTYWRQLTKAVEAPLGMSYMVPGENVQVLIDGGVVA